MSKTPPGPGSTRQQFKGQDGTSGHGGRAGGPAAGAQRAPTRGDGSDLLGDTLPPRRTSLCNSEFVFHYQPPDYYERALDKSSNYFATYII